MVRQVNSPDQTMAFGVPRFTDNSFASITNRTLDDYDWFPVTRHNSGEVWDMLTERGYTIGAIKSDVNAPVSARAQATVNIALHVTTRELGSINSHGTHNIIMTNFYAFPDEYREIMRVGHSRSFNNPTIFNEQGEIVQLQSPVRGGASFETLGIISGHVQSSISANRTTAFLSDTIDWTVRSSITLPETGLGSGDGSIIITQTLPRGLDYQIGSGHVGNVVRDPIITANGNGTTTLTWNLFLNANNSIDDVSFTTSINPMALDGAIQRSLTVTNVISSPLDGRQVSLRQTQADVNILQVGMIGVHTTINSMAGERNTDYTVIVNPFTTVEDERDVVGIIPLPKDNDNLGSNFSGSAILSAIQITGRDDVLIYLNNDRITSAQPQMVDLSRGGWRRWDGTEEALSGTQTIYFKIPGVMTHRDNIRIAYTLQTYGNNFGDEFYNQTTVNSASHFRTSPTSNITRYRIQADAELILERLRIFTGTVEDGLTARILMQALIFNDRARDEEFIFVVYDKEADRRLFEYEVTLATLARETEFVIPSEFLYEDSTREFEIRIEGYNENRVHAIENTANVYGTTATHERHESLLKTNDPIVLEGIVMHEQIVGGDASTYYERLIITPQRVGRIRTGFGFGVNHKITYENDLGVGNVDLPRIQMLMDYRLVDGEHQSNGTSVEFDLELVDTIRPNILDIAFKLPQVWVESITGSIFNTQEPGRTLYDGGNKVYVPIELSHLGEYRTVLQTAEGETIGANAFSFSLEDLVYVFAHMYAHTDPTGRDAKIFLRPVLPSTQSPEGWTAEELNWLRKY